MKTILVSIIIFLTFAFLRNARIKELLNENKILKIGLSEQKESYERFKGSRKIINSHDIATLLKDSTMFDTTIRAFGGHPGSHIVDTMILKVSLRVKVDTVQKFQWRW
jgi:hypothetical protein